MAQDYYSILGVARDASAQDIKKAFRQIARECHPDVAGNDPSAEERFKTARKAYETLMDPVTRARYDRRGQRRAHPRGSFFDAFYRSMGGDPDKASRNPGGFTPGAHDAGGHASARGADKDPGNDLDLDDLFNDFGDFGFGGKRPSSQRDRVRTAPPPPPRDVTPTPGADVHVELDVPVNVARSGGSVTAVYYRMQRADSWRPGSVEAGVVRIQDIADIRIVPGAHDGQVLRERGLGDAGPHGGPYGDLVVRVRVVGSQAQQSRTRAGQRQRPPPPPPRYPGGMDGHEMVLDMSVVEALLGGRIELHTPQGTVKLTIPPGTSSGTKLRLKAKGPPDAMGDPTDLVVRTRIVVPSHIDEESRALIERFARLNPGNPRD